MILLTKNEYLLSRYESDRFSFSNFKVEHAKALQTKQQRGAGQQLIENEYPHVNGSSVTAINGRNMLSEQKQLPHQYDAFLLYVNKDGHFAKEVLSHMEGLNVKVSHLHRHTNIYCINKHNLYPI